MNAQRGQEGLLPPDSVLHRAAERLAQQLVHPAEVVGHRTQRHARGLGDLAVRGPGYADVGWRMAELLNDKAGLAGQAGDEAPAAQYRQQALAAVGFLNPAAPKKLMPRLRQLFNRAQPSAEEIHILRGIARAMQDAAGAKKH